MTSPSPDDPTQTALERSNAARRRLADTLGQLQRRVKPEALARDVIEGITKARRAATRRSLDTVQQRPTLIAGVAIVVGLFIARGRIAKLFRHHETAKTQASLSSKRARARSKGTPS